jgi:hypothetical protein
VGGDSGAVADPETAGLIKPPVAPAKEAPMVKYACETCSPTVTFDSAQALAGHRRWKHRGEAQQRGATGKPCGYCKRRDGTHSAQCKRAGRPPGERLRPGPKPRGGKPAKVEVLARPEPVPVLTGESTVAIRIRELVAQVQAGKAAEAELAEVRAALA